MMSLLPTLASVLILTLDLVVSAGTALADEGTTTCTSEPQARWMSFEAVSKKAAAAGYPEVRHIGITGSCYELDALTARRMRADVVMNPVTGDVVRAWAGY